MRELLKSFYIGSIKLLNSIVSFFSVLMFNKYGINKKIKALKNTKKSKSVSILAGGISAKEILSKRRDLLDKSDILVLNYFGNSKEFFELKPKYYILLDPAFFDVKFRNNSLNEENTNNDCSHQKNLFENFRKVDWPMILFLPYKRKGIKMQDERLKTSNIKIVEFHATRILGFIWFQNWMYFHNQGLPSSRNVIIPAMQLMANIGYKTIYLYGCEFSWTKTMEVNPENGKMFFNDRHFYNESEMRYFNKGGYKWWLEAIVESLNGTEQIAAYVESIGVNIVNRTKGSFIDAFRYENIDKLIYKTNAP